MIKKVVTGTVILIILVITYNLVKQTIAVLKSGERLSQAVDSVYKLEIKNKELKKQMQSIGSREFIEEVARDKLGLVKEGETIVVIPEEKIRMVLGASQSAQIRLPNWLGWIKVFFK